MQLIGPIATKICKQCLLEFPVSEFYKHSETKDRLRSECKRCWSVNSNKYHIDNRETILPKRREYHFKTNYNISLHELDLLKEAQQYRCAICNKLEPLVVDHCHISNKLRSLLCAKCNQGLGSFNDNPQTLRDAADYIEAH